MAKNAKKGVTSHGKPITDFFTLTSKPRVPPSRLSQASSSQDIRVTGASEATELLLNKSKVASIASKTLVESSSRAPSPGFLDVSESSSSQYSTKRSSSKSLFTSPAATTSLKRRRSADCQAHPRASNSLTSKKVMSDRRKGKFDSDSDIEQPTTVVYVNSPQRRKKARTSPLEIFSRVGSLVPGSQSGEEDLVSMEEQTHPPMFTRECNENMERSADNNLISAKATSTDYRKTPNSIDHSIGQVLTPSTDHPFIAPTLLPLDPATKTAQIIAQIKARAYAKIQTSPEVARLEFVDDLDDSSDDDSFLPILPFVTKPVSSKDRTLLATFEDDSIKYAPRYSLRNRSPTSSPSNSTPSSRLSRGSPARCPSPPKVIKDNTGKAKKDPFDALLKEKKLAEKCGKGHDAFRRAETTTGKFGIDGLLDEMDGEDDLYDWNDEDAAASIVRDQDWLINRPLTPDSSRGNTDDLRLGDVDRQKLFGRDGGKAIMGILEHDKIAKREGVLNRQVPGLRFWSLPEAIHSTAIVTDEAPSIPEFPVTSPLICHLKKLIQRGDLSRAALIFNTDFLSTAKPIEQSAIAQYLCELVLSSQRTLLSEPASRALESHWGLKTTTCGLSFSQVLAAVQRLGVDVTVLSSQKWPVSTMRYAEFVTTEIREDFMRRLINLVNVCTRSNKFPVQEAPDLVLLLLLTGTDVSTSPDLQLDIIQSINLICNYITSGDMDFEVSLCSKVLNCMASYEPMNKAHLISSLSAGTGSTKRIASFIAYCVVIDRTTVSIEIYSDFPPLENVLEQLDTSASLGSSKFSLSETTNYLDLGYYISILAIALSNIRGYVTEERRTSKTKYSTCHPPLSPHKRTERPKDLQLVYTALETLHSNISDSKALHLERSRTKAILKGLSMYIHYQRDYWLKHDRGPQSKKLLHYFKKAP